MKTEYPSRRKENVRIPDRHNLLYKNNSGNQSLITADIRNLLKIFQPSILGDRQENLVFFSMNLTDGHFEL